MSLNTCNTYLMLDDLSVWPGKGFGHPAPPIEDLADFAGYTDSAGAFNGEVVFNTAMTGYHEVLTDPSYTGQLVLMTYPHMGNYGCDEHWSETGPGERRTVTVQGMIVRSLYEGPVPAGRQSLGDFLYTSRVCGICDVDTRALTLKIRRRGSCNGIIVRSGEKPDGKRLAAAERYLGGMPSMSGCDLSGRVGIGEPHVYNQDGKPHIALLDCGMKQSILRHLLDRGARVSLLPSNSGVEAVLESRPDALLFSNGPGDPEPLKAQARLAAALMGRIPLWGICLGHQILSLGLGAKTYKMPFGHHGVNHPVRDESSGRVFVTSQNHGFAVDESTLPSGWKVRFRNTNDGSIEGIENRKQRVLCVQHHPEAGPGPVDSTWIFDAFFETLDR